MEGLLIFLTVLLFLCGPVVLILLIVYIVKTTKLLDKVQNLQIELIKLKGIISRTNPEEESASTTPNASAIRTDIEPSVPTTAVTPAQPESKQVEIPKSDVPEPLPNLLGIIPENIHPSAPISETPKPVPEYPVVKKSRTKAEWEALIGGKWLNWIGAIALIIGMGFFLKYAFDKNWITETMRVLMGGAVGSALLLGGMYAHKKGLQIISQGLIGSGISVLYLSVFASFNFYHLVSQLTAFILMSIVSTITFSIALKYNSLAVSLLGWVGGFLTPILLSTGQINEIGLFTYIALLDIGILAVVMKKDSWVILEPLTFIGTYIFYLVWYSQFYTPNDLYVTVSFISIFWGLFYLLDVIRIIKSKNTFPEIRQIIAALNALFYYIFMYVMIDPQHDNWMGLITLAIGIIYLVTILALKRRNPSDKLIVPRYVLTAITLLIIATAIQFTGFTIVTFWAIEAFILVCCGIYWNLRYVWMSALGLFFVSIIKLVGTDGAFNYSPFDKFQFIFNLRALAFAALALACGASTILFKRLEAKTGKPIQLMLHYTWTILIFIVFTVEVNDAFKQLIAGGKDATYFRFIKTLTLAAGWMIYSLPLVWAGMKRNISAITYSGLSIVIISVFTGCIWGFRFAQIEKFNLLINIRAVIMVFIMLGLLLHTRFLKNKQQSYHWADTMSGVFYCLWCIVLFVLCTFETNDYFRKLLSQTGGSAHEILEYNRSLILPIVWMIYSLLLVSIGFMKNLRSVFYPGLIAAILAIFTGVISGFSYYQVDRFIPILNIRGVALIVLIIGSIIHAQLLISKKAVYHWTATVYNIVKFVIILLILDLITMETIDCFEKAISSLASRFDLTKEISRLRDMQQLALSSVWLLYAIILTIIGIWRRMQWLRISAIIFFGLTILKIFIYDLSFLETLYRIFSFIGLGLILLLVSYLYHRYKSVIFGTVVKKDQ